MEFIISFALLVTLHFFLPLELLRLLFYMCWLFLLLIYYDNLEGESFFDIFRF